VAITTLTLAFALEAKQERVAVTNLAESTQALAAAQAGVATALSRLDRLSAGTAPAGAKPVDPRDPWQWADTLVGETAAVGNASYDVHVRDLGSMFDINVTNETDWRAFLTGLALDATVVDQLTDAIADWKDPDDDPRGNGAERDAYISAGRVVLPANRLFSSVDELRDVMGMTPEIYRMIEPYLFIRGVRQISINTAPVAVLHSNPGLTDNVIDAIMSARNSGQRIDNMNQLIQVAGPGTRRRLQSSVGTFTFTTQLAEIVSTGWAPGHRVSATAIAVVIRGTPPNGATVLWRRNE